MDLNPIRAAIPKTPEQSDYNSVQERIERPQSNGLRPFAENESYGIPFKRKDYLEVVDWGGRAIDPLVVALSRVTRSVADFVLKGFSESQDFVQPKIQAAQSVVLLVLAANIAFYL